MFRLRREADVQAQRDLASAILSPEFQQAFSERKGSIPARKDLSSVSHDSCARESARTFAAAARAGTLVPSVAHGMAVPQAAEAALRDAVSAFWNAPRISIEQAQARMLESARAR